MYVGPFFYLNNPHNAHQGLYADLLPADKAHEMDGRLTSPVTHRELLARIAPDADCQAIPRGQVVYDLESSQAIIYLDHCLEIYLDDIVRLFELTAWVFENDEQYVCPRCAHLANRF
ncbi:MAG TPA: hypothetical protein DD640_08555 [Clostridiales bacterium]|nr:hypothetical protein [Clostridiales bacterium]